jgi:hypothetical protein
MVPFPFSSTSIGEPIKQISFNGIKNILGISILDLN